MSSPARADELTSLPQDPLAETSTDKPRPPALLVDDTPSSAEQSQQHSHAFGGAPHLAASQPDPILDDSQPLPFSFTTPDSIASLGSTLAQRPALSYSKPYSMQERLEDPQASYVPGPAGPSAHGKVKTVEEDQVQRVRHALQNHLYDEQARDSCTQQTISMDLDENGSTNLPPARSPQLSPATDAGVLKRRSTTDPDANVDDLDTSALPRSKRQRCSEASEIEV